MILTTKDKIEHLTLDLLLLRAELEAYIRGEWRHEYYWTIGYNKIFTGRKILISAEKLTNT